MKDMPRSTPQARCLPAAFALACTFSAAWAASATMCMEQYACVYGRLGSVATNYPNVCFGRAAGVKFIAAGPCRRTPRRNGANRRRT